MPPKTRTVLVKLVSTAGTGFFYTTTKVRTAERKIARMKYDPRGMDSFSPRLISRFRSERFYRC
ncbi:hypothetical protein MJO29_015330 [Puccinia striiformis f. sp. tritici]|nr:hypothetical protein MJO29_015330 [Puccinia striiformis f. sp. tritici]